jgi:acyl-CoA synthetase (AMP-forming)/AMP-acid ligase II
MTSPVTIGAPSGVRPLDDPLAVGDVLRATASSRPGAPAIVDEKGTMTYAELDAAADNVAGGLASLGITHGDAVAYLLYTQREALISFFACARLGAVVVPLNQRLTATEIAYQIDAASVRHVIVDHRLSELLDGMEERMGDGSCAVTVVGSEEDGFAALERTGSLTNRTLDRVPSADDVCSIWFTSGTTGPPKGAVVRHRSEIAAAIALAVSCSFTSETRLLGAAPLFHRAPTVVTIAAILVGGAIYLREAFRPDEVLDLIERERLTAGFIVPTMAWMLVNAPGARDRDLASMDCWMSASSPLTPALEEAINSTFDLPHGVSNFYGITEILLLTGRRGGTPGSVGRVVSQVALRIFDGARFLPAGEVGEIVAAAPTTFSHYLNNPAATDSATITIDGRCWYRSGDVGYLDSNGDLFLVDRAKDMIISGGENVYSAEVEFAVAAHPAIAEVAVIGVPDEKWGERVIAYCTLVPAASEPTLESVWTDACAGLAKFKRPTEVRFVPQLPKNGFGKVRKDVIRRMAIDSPANH